ncbi:polyketide synthase [Thalassobaculum fulvum]|uniref:Polyketide synthase n=1 Tax=Thalassobaculum fulvum TaxID=1633335 RepID=A0A919CPZ7_9PROT|nr:type I polyketide synthase [Thalassobaculum fulvum]GHD52872.1 polyketide synthase [Thalassobaculum fulvum]
MNDIDLREKDLREKQRTVLLLRQMQAKLDAAERRAREPVAVIGIGLRMPGGAEDADAFWDMLEAGTDAVTEVPPERWDADTYYDPDPDAPGKMNTRWGGFLRNVDRFDAEFFGVSPREAVSMDPQQRLVLETAWRALEHAGVPPQSLAGSRTGVFLGICTSDYARLGDASGTLGALDTYSGTGGACGVAAGRLSYTLGLQGPSLVVDTACSSSLVATHLAVQSLRLGECRLALAGGANLVLLPDGTVTLSRLHMMAPDGRCKPFDAAADGFVRGEGCGVVVLKKLADARADGDRVLAVISGSAVNQDGRSSGLTAPNGLAQERVVRDALANAGRKPAEVAYVEAHGTGTALGDPIEMNALAAVMAEGRTDPLVVGSVKANLGHLEAAAGIAGLIKAIGVVRRRRVPPVLHLKTLNPHIQPGACPLEVPSAPATLPDGATVAGVSSFGFSGTNAHLVVEAAPAEEPAAVAGRPVEVLPLSARSPEALGELAAAVAASPALAWFGDACFSAATGRGAFEHRLAVVAADGAEAIEALTTAQPREAGSPRIAFLFSGQGAQLSGMGRALYQTEPAFCDAIDRCAAVLDPLLGRPLTALLFEGGADLDRTEFAQPALAAFELAMAGLLAEWGIVPDAVLGHSLGEYAAAIVAGAVELEPALNLIAARGRMMQALPAGGAMAAVMAGADRVAPVLARHPELSLAADNGPAATTIAGPAAAVEAACAELEADGVTCRRLAVSHAFHSTLVEPVLDDLRTAAGAVEWRAPTVPLVGNLDGREVAGFDAGYWVRHSREPVAFAAGMRRLREIGCDTFVELGPQPVLLGLGRTVAEGGEWLATARRDDPSTRPLMAALARLWELGAPVDWKAVHKGRGRRLVDLPGHPFRRRSFWRSRGNPALAPGGHPLLREPIALPDGRTVFRFALPAPGAAYLAEHRVGGTAIAPAAALLEVAVSAADRAGLPATLADLSFDAPLPLHGPLDGLREATVTLDGDTVAIDSRGADGAWTRHLTARLSTDAPADWTPAESAEAVDPAALYGWLADGGVDLGPGFRRIVEARRGSDAATVTISGVDPAGHRIHPTVLDAMLQALAVVTLGRGDGAMRIPAGAGRATIGPAAAGEIIVHARLRGDAMPEADIVALDADGRTVAAIEGLRLAAGGVEEPWQRWLLARAWRAVEAPNTAAEIAEAVAAGVPDRLAGAGLDGAGLDGLADLGVGLDAAAGGYAAAALAAVPAEQVVERQRQLYARLPLLAEAGWGTDPEALLDDLAARHPGSVTEIDLLRRCGSALPAVLTGDQDPLALIFPPEDSGAGGGNVYRDSPVSALLNGLVEDAVLAALPAAGPIRILEVGAGTGGTTDGLLARLPADRMAEYAFTDIAPALLAQARSRYADRPWLETRQLDLDRDPKAQGLEVGRYHVVVAANVVHATRDLKATLARLRDLLVPGGAVVLLEGAGPQGWIDLVFGLTEGWWRFADRERRPDYPLPERDGWRDVLAESGFEPAEVAADAPGVLDRQAVLVARRRPGAWLLAGGDDPVTVALAGALGATRIAAGDPIPDGNWDGCVYTGALGLDEAPADPEALLDGQQRLLDPTRRLALDLAARGIPLAMVTAGATTDRPLQAPLWGLGRAIAAELPALGVRLIDIDPGLAAQAVAAALARELAAGDGEDQVRLGDGTRAVARLERVVAERPALPTLDPEAAYLVTGGFGGLGLRTAEWLADRGARRIVLMGHSAPSAAAEAGIAKLEARGVTVVRSIGDVANEADVRAALAVAPGRLAGVIHAAGTLDDGPLAELDWPRMRRVLEAKVVGAWLLDRLAGDLDLFVLYSSAVGLIGTAGQANHIAANAYLDALAARRRAEGRPAVSLAWGAWSEIGSATSEALHDRMRASGMDPIPPEQGVRVLDWALGDRALGDVPACVGVLPVRWPAFAAALDGEVPRVLAELVPAVRQAAKPAPAAVPIAAQGPSRAAPRSFDLLDTIRTEAAAVLAAEGADAIDPRRNLFELGLDSLMAVELRNRLQARLERPLPSTLLFDHPTPAALADFLGDAGAAEAVAARPQAEGDAVAIVGMGCRFPGGADDPGAFWRLLCEGFDAVGEFPPDRWADAGVRERMTTKWGAFLDGVDRFDAAFFRIAPREAASMDPQQRILLETAWHALEDAGQAPDRLAGSPTGVFMGLCNYDYAQIASGGGRIDAWSGTGGAPSIVAGRLAYVLGLSGPAMVVDTACSSSLVALHLACRSLIDGDCRMALAGGVNLILAPSSTVALSELQMMAPDGRCKAFDARADGFVRGEGCGVVVLKRLADARADGDRVLAVVRGSFVNQDGRSSSLTAPNGAAQEAVIRGALQRAGIAPAAVGYVEAHGTGTALGDPIEIHALKSVFAAGRPDSEPLAVGAVKSNLGHLEAAAGIAGLIKAVQAIRHGAIPPNRHFERLNPHIDLDGFPVLLPQAPTPWPDRDGTRIAAVSSFGFSGTNAHVVLEQAPEAAEPETAPDRVQLVVASGATPEAARAVAEGYADALAGTALADLAHTALVGRAQLGHRIAVAGTDAAGIAAALRDAVPSDAATTPPRVGFVFTGQGAQYAGMGRSLYDAEPAFRDTVDRIAAEMAGELDRPLLEILSGDGVDRTGQAQPALFAVGVALAELYRSWGIEPAAVLGHSVGEFAAACVAGAVPLEDAARLIARRGRMMDALPDGGAMAAVQAGEATVVEAIGAEPVSVAALNGPEATVISGEGAVVERVLARLEAADVAFRRLTVSHAFHSACMDPVLDELERAAGECAWSEPRVPLLSNLTGAPAGGFDAAYWRDHARRPVRFADGVAAMAGLGCTVFLELGPQPVLTGLGRRVAGEAAWIPALRRDADDATAALDALGRLFTAGVDIDGRAVAAGRGGRIVRLPTYPFERRRYWVESAPAAAPRPRRAGHPLLGAPRRSPGKRRQYEAELSVAALPWLADHAVRGVPTVPAAATLEMLAAAAGDGPVAVEDVRFGGLLTLDAPQLAVTDRDGMALTVEATPLDGDDWRPVAEASVADPGEMASVDLDGVRRRCSDAVDVAGFYDAFPARGLAYGPAFRAVAGLHQGDGEALARLVLPDGLDPAGFRLHPSLLDGAFQSLGAAARGVDVTGEGHLPARLDRMTWSGTPAGRELWAWTRLRTGRGGELIGDVTLLTDDGAVVARADGLRLVPAREAASRPAAVHDVVWQEAAADREMPARVAVAGPASPVLAEALAVSGIAVAETAESPETVIWSAPAYGEPAALCAALTGLALDLAGRDAPPRLAVVALGAVTVPDDPTPPSVAHGALAGLVATVAREHPELDPVLIDAEPTGVPEALRCGGPVLAVRGGRVFVRSVEPRAAAGSGAVFALDRPDSGQLAELALRPAAMPQPGSGQVRIAVTAAGLNFRDVMNALGTYPGDGGRLGGECAGIVDALGEGVDGLAIGDRVMAVAPGCHASHAVGEAPLVLPVPAGWSDEQAATMPTVFLTAAWALRRDGALGAGQRVLVHAGTGGLGLAAIQVARAAGAEVLATAGSDEKREYLRGLGIACVSDSRSRAFVDDVMAHTGGAGVDIVLNSLSGELIAGGFEVLKPGGRYLEAGKAGIWSEEQARAARPDVAYRPVALDAEIVRDPAAVGAFWHVLMAEFAAGTLQPLPVTPFAMADAEGAYRFMQQARHIGRIALTRRFLRGDAAYLVTGGTGGVGPAVARWLLMRGAGQVVLTARSEPEPAVLDPLRRLGDVRFVSADLSDGAQVDALVTDLDRPLAGVFHAAGALDDGVLEQMTEDRFRAVMAAKLDGALALDRATRGQPLDHFVLFSSAAGVLGSAGQANYAAANAGLDALAHRRRAEGLPALCIDWGAWHGAGMAAGRAGPALEPEQALAALEALLADGTAQAVVLPEPLSVADAEPESPSAPALRERLATTPEAERPAMLREAVREQVAGILSLPAAGIDARRALNEYGLDSLMAVELRNALAGLCGERLPASLIFDYPTVQALAGFLLERMAGALPAPPAEPPPPTEPPGAPMGAPMSDADAAIDDTMSEEELARALMLEVDRAGF